MQIINTQEKFEKLCLNLLSERIIAVDTEFCRRKTYYATLSLIQISTNSEKIIIDVLSGINVDSFKKILASEDILKIFHAPDQDFDIFYHKFGELPKNIFDTQVAAELIGMGDMNSYAKLCKEILHITLDKSLQKEDWLQRPLKQKFLDYAIKDVEYLIALYRNLSDTIKGRNLSKNYQTRLKKLLSPDSYKLNIHKAMKKASILDRSQKFKEAFQHIAMLREECAQQLNLPRPHCASDQELITLCEKLPTNDAELSKIYMKKTALLKAPFKNKLFELCLGLKE